MSAPVRDLVFISYSHENPEWRDRLSILLKPFVRQGRLQIWADPYIETGSLWRREIYVALERSLVGVILLAPDLLASDFVADVEIPQLLRAAQEGWLTWSLFPYRPSHTAQPRLPTATFAISSGRGQPSSRTARTRLVEQG